LSVFPDSTWPCNWQVAAFFPVNGNFWRLCYNGKEIACVLYGTKGDEKNFGKILIVDDDADVLQAAKTFLKQHVESVRTEKNPVLIPQLLATEAFDVILLDMNFTRDVSSGQEGFFWLKKILALDSQAVVVLITAYGDVDLAVRAIKEGASDFVLKPWQNEKLLATVSAALHLHSSRSEANHLRRPPAATQRRSGPSLS